MRTLAKGAVAALALTACTTGASAPAMAGDEHGNFMVRALVTGVLPDTDATVRAGGAVIPGADAEVSDEVIPATTLTYFFNDNISMELFCCFAKHDLDAKGTIAGFGKLADTWIFPPALTAQYHFNTDGRWQPYVGAGVQYIAFFDEKSYVPGSTGVSIDDAWGFTLQAGLDVSIGNGWFLNADVKKTWLDTDITWAGTGITASADIDPLIISAGFGYRFNLSDIFGHRTQTASIPLK